MKSLTLALVFLCEATSLLAQDLQNRTLVQVAGSPALQRDTTLHHDVWTTVSCGVATLWPSLPGSDPVQLIADADAAMYRAKQEGRNRVCSAPASPSPSRLTVFPGGAQRA